MTVTTSIQFDCKYWCSEYKVQRRHVHRVAKRATNVGHCDGGLNRTRRICLLSPESRSPHATESQHKLACASNSRRCHASLLPLKNHGLIPSEEGADNSRSFVETYYRRTTPPCGVLVSPVAKPRLRLSTQQPV